MRMLTKLLFRESGAHTDVRGLLLLASCYFVPSLTPYVIMMKLSRARFKYSLRFTKQHESQLRKDALANKLAQGKPDEFWKDVRLMNTCRTPLPCSIDGVSGDANIAGVWKEHFEQLFNCINDVGDVTFPRSILVI